MLTIKEVAARLGVTPRRVRAMVKSGRLRAKKFGLMLAVDDADLSAVMNRKPGKPKKNKKIS